MWEVSSHSKVANALTTTNYNVTCLTETWLAEDVPDEALLLQQYQIYREDRPDETTSSKHGGVLIGINLWTKHDLIRLNMDRSEYNVVKIDTVEPILFSCVYNRVQIAHTGSPVGI